MSRNFEVLEQLQQDQELFRVPPVTKAVPANGRPTNGKVVISDLDAFTREEILRLVQFLFLATNGEHGRHGPRRVVFCGVDEADGSTLLCARVGRSLSEQVRSQVCVVNANVRVPASGPLFDLLPSDSPQSEKVATQKLLRQVTDNLWCISSDSVPTQGDAKPFDQVRTSIRDLSDDFEYVVISAPPIGLHSDAVLLGQIADGVVLVLEANTTRRVAALRAKQKLEARNVRLLGTVLNNRTFPIPEEIYRRL